MNMKLITTNKQTKQTIFSNIAIHASLIHQPNTKFRPLLIRMLLMGLLLVGCTKKYVPCEEVDGTQACYLEETGQFAFEEGASIAIGGLPASVIQPLTELWNERYPNHPDVLSFDTTKDATTAIQARFAEEDIVYVYEELSGVYQSQLYPLDQFLFNEVYPEIKEETKKNTDKSDLDHNDDETDTAVGGVGKESIDLIANGKETPNKATVQIVSPIQSYYVPIAYDGVAFFYNKTMLEAIGVDLIDVNEDGMPDAFDRWEKIFAMADAWQTKRPIYKKKPINIVFPFSLNEHYLSYFMISGNGFRLFPDNDGNNPGFASESFLRALDFVVEASQHPMAVHPDQTPYTAEDYVWQWEKVFTSETAPFGIVAPWMDLTGAAKANRVEYVVTPYFPTFQDEAVVPFATTTGFVIRANTKYPSAAHEVMQFLKSNDVLQILMDEMNLIPFYYDNQQLSFQTNNESIQSTLAFADNIPLIALPNNVYKKATDGYYEINLMEVIRKLWNQEQSPEETQLELEERYQTWLLENALETTENQEDPENEDPTDTGVVQEEESSN